MSIATGLMYKPPIALSTGQKRKRPCSNGGGVIVDEEEAEGDDDMGEVPPTKVLKTSTADTSISINQNVFKMYVQNALDELDKVRETCRLAGNNAPA